MFKENVEVYKPHAHHIQKEEVHKFDTKYPAHKSEQ
jgi:hypothetical protein